MKFAFRVSALLFLIFIGIGSTFLFRKIPQVGAQSNPCYPRYDASVQIPPGYGAAFNIFSPGKDLILKVSCPSSDALFSAGISDTNYPQYTYKNAYRWDGTHWISITLRGTAVDGTGGNWLKAPASTTIAKGVFRPSGLYNFIAAYTCTFVGGAWKCGCRGTTCPLNLWQLQAFRSPIVLTPTGGSCTTGGQGPTWVQFNTASIPTSKTTGELGITETDLRLIIKTRTGQSELVSMEQARQILQANANLSSFGLTAPITVSWSGSTLNVFYKGKLIQTFEKPTASSLQPEWGPVSFDQLALADRPTVAGAEYYIEALMQYNFRYSGATVGFEVRAALIGAGGGGSCGTGGGWTGGGITPPPKEFSPITSCGSVENISSGTNISSRASANGCHILVLAPGSYPGFQISSHQGGVVTVKCAQAQACTMGNSDITNADGVIIDGVSIRGGGIGLDIESSKNIQVLNAKLWYQTGSGVLIAGNNNQNIQIYNSEFFNDVQDPSIPIRNGQMDYGIRIYNTSNIHIKGNKFSTLFNHAISTKESVAYALIENNLFIDCGRNCIEQGQEPEIVGQSGITSGEGVIQKNTFQNVPGNAILIKNIHKVTVTGNTFSNVSSKVEIYTFTSCPKNKEGCVLINGGVPSDRQVIQN